MTKPTSRKKKQEDQHPHQHYPTEPPVAEFMVSLLPRPTTPITILDPGSGTGVFAAALRKVWSDVPMTIVGVDIEIVPPVGLYDEFIHESFLSYAQRETRRFDLVLGNPPYGDLAEPFIWCGLHLTRRKGSLMYLLALEFLSSRGRAEDLYLTAPPRHVYISARRLDFTGGGGDMRNHMFALWKKGWKGVGTHSWVDYKSAGFEQLPLFEESI